MVISIEEAAIIGYNAKLIEINFAMAELRRKLRIREEQVERGRELGRARLGHRNGRRKPRAQ